jgi:phage/plasmid-like protein (TIGR03299 family)
MKKLTIAREINPDNALQDSGLDWRVEKRPVMVWSQKSDDRDYVVSDQYIATVRTDTEDILGIVSDRYEPIQNQDLLWCAEKISKGNLSFVGAGYTGNGERVFAQLNGNPWGIGPKKDEVYPTFILSNGHDGNHPVSAWPTSIRLICENSLNMSASQANNRGHMMISLRHRGTASDLLESIMNSVGEFQNRSEAFHTRAQILAGCDLNTEQIQAFWTNVYTKMFGKIYTNPETKEQVSSNDSAASTMIKWSNVFDAEKNSSGTNLWTAMNSVTHWLDHGQVYRGANKSDNRFNDIVFGSGASEKVKVMDLALQHI